MSNKELNEQSPVTEIDIQTASPQLRQSQEKIEVEQQEISKPGQKKDEKYLELLLQELERSYSTLNNHYNILTQILLVAITVVGGLIAYIYSQNQQPSIILLFLSPLPAVGICGVGLLVLYQVQSLLYFCRITISEIKELVGNEKPLFYYDQRTFSSRFQSFKSGNPTLRLTIIGLFITPIVLCIGLITFSFIGIYVYWQNHFLGSLFLLVYGFSLLWLFRGIIGCFIEFPALYREYINKLFSTSSPLSPKVSKENRFFLLPRPVDFFSKIPYFFIGAYIAYVKGQIIFQSNLQDAILSPIPAPPIMGTLLFVLLWFVIQEVFIQQAKYIWNDIRDRRRDKIIPANQTRPTVNQKVDSFLYISLLVRLGLGLVFAYILSTQLFVVALYICVLQIIYELWAKPKSNQVPLVPVALLSIIATGPLLRFLGGALAMGWSITDEDLLLYSVIIFSIGVVYIATMWKVEAEHFLKLKIPFQRGQSSYFLQNGQIWLATGVIVGLSAGGLLLSKQLPPYTLPFTTTLTPGWLTVIGIGIFIVVGTIFCIAVFLFLSLCGRFLKLVFRSIQSFFHRNRFGIFLMQKVFGKISLLNLVSNHISSINWIAVVILSFVGLWLFYFFTQPSGIGYLFTTLKNEPASVITFLALCILFYMYSITDYEQFALLYAKKNLPSLGGAISTYFFTANSNITFGHIIRLALSLNNPNFQEIMKDNAKVKD